MRLIVFCLFVAFLASCSKSSSQPPYFWGLGNPIENESAPQRVANTYSSLLSLTANQKTAVKTAVASLEAANLYNKFISINIPAFRLNNRVLNLIVPAEYDGSLALVTESGTPTYGASGVTLSGTGDKLNTFFVNDLATNAPDIGAFWITDVGVSAQIISSTSPFNIFPRLGDGKAYVNIWNNSTGVAVPAPPIGFSLAQRNGGDVEIYQGATKYSVATTVNSSAPTNNNTFIQGGADVFVLKLFGFCETLTEAEVATVKTIFDQLITDLGL